MTEVERHRKIAEELRKKAEVFEDELIDDMLAVGRVDEAFDLMEKARKRRLVEAYLAQRQAERAAQGS